MNDPVIAPEARRLAFLIERDGLEGARAWARRTQRLYMAALRDNGRDGGRQHFASTREYRRRFVLSCLAFRRFVRL